MKARCARASSAQSKKAGEPAAARKPPRACSLERARRRVARAIQGTSQRITVQVDSQARASRKEGVALVDIDQQVTVHVDEVMRLAGDQASLTLQLEW